MRRDFREQVELRRFRAPLQPTLIIIGQSKAHSAWSAANHANKSQRAEVARAVVVSAVPALRSAKTAERAGIESHRFLDHAALRPGHFFGAF